MKNKLTDLNDALFAQLERLNDEDMPSDKLADEIKRSQAMVQVSDQIVGNAKLQLDAAKFIAEHGTSRPKLPPSIGLLAGQEVPPGGSEK